MIELSTPVFLGLALYALIGALVIGSKTADIAWNFKEQIVTKRKLLQTQRELAEAQLQALKGRGM
jgi:hypothetical protein